MLTVKPAQLKFTLQGVPCSKQYDDPYFSLHNACEQSRYVFIQGNQLAQRWSQDCQHFQPFTIAELGFGFGVNFIISCQEWLKHRTQRHLHYISFEKHPVRKQDLGTFHEKLNLLPELSLELIEYYPIGVEGSHRIHFTHQNITLTLIYGDALKYLQRSNFQAHAWYLDGFSPNKNPQLWNKEIANQVFRLTLCGGTFATYSAASFVSHNFSSAGFMVEKQTGYNSKREMLIGTKNQSIKQELLAHKYKNWLNTKPQEYNNKSAIIVGAGMAGCLLSAALAKRGWKITLIDKNTSLASEGSGNPNAILMPRLSIDHDIQSQLTLQGFLYSIYYFTQLSKTTEFGWQQSGAIQLPRDDAQWKRMQTIFNNHCLPEELAIPVSQQQASHLAQCKLAKQGWHIPLAAYLTPSLLCDAVVKLYQSNITFISDTNIHNIEKQNNQWVASDQHNHSHYAEVVILANALSIDQYPQSHWCSLNPKRGQITYIPEAECNISLTKIICSDAYITPEIDSHLIVGATFVSDDQQTDIRQHEHEENLLKLSSMISSFEFNNQTQFKGRAAIRAVSDDRLPVVGPVSIENDFYADYKHAALGATNQLYPTSAIHRGLYVASGFGSRGLAWIPVCTEALACIINKEPSPIDNNLLQAIHPNRLLMKKMIQKRQSK